MNRRWAPGAVLAGGGAAMLLLALWVRDPLLPYGEDSAGASGAAAASSASDIASDTRASALSSLRSALTVESGELRREAELALAAPAASENAFDHLARSLGSPDEGIVLFENDLPVAWAGRLVTDPTHVSAPIDVSITPFYTTMSIVARRGIRRAVATSILHAEPPANRLAKTLDQRLPGRDEVESFTFAAAADTAVGQPVLNAGGVPLLRANVTPLPREMVRFAHVAKARGWGTLLLAVGLLVILAVAWRNRTLLAERLIAIAICLVAIALVPWSSLSNVARAFDPTYYYSPIGGQLTANAGVLTITAALLLLAVYAIVRSRRVRPPKTVAIAAAIAAGLAGPALVLAAAPGIATPAWGTTAALWLTWETPLFLILFAFWLAAFWLMKIAIGRRATIHLRAATAVAIIAGFAAGWVVWRTTTEERLDLAVEDVLSLERPDGDAATWLRRFASELTRYSSAGTRADLLKRYAVSDLAAADLPLALASWSPAGQRGDELRLAPVTYDSAVVARLVAAARDSAQPIIVQTLGVAGRQVLMAAMHPDSSVTTAVVSPRTQLIAPDPFVSLLGFSPPVRTDPPYTVAISDVTPQSPAASTTMTWRRVGHEMHGDRIIETSNGIARAHIEVDLRSVPARMERAVLIVVFNAFLAGILWALGAIAEGGFVRWVRARSSRWLRSYRGRLSLALSAFFIIPALAFALWSYQRLRGEDRDVRELLVRETLNAVVAGADSAGLGGVARPYNTPLFLYSSGLLGTSSDELLDDLAPAGRSLPPSVYFSVVQRGEPTASWVENVGTSQVLFGYRTAPGPEQQHYVLAAPARSDEVTLDRRRRDLAILVLFATVMGAVAAVWLSGVAAKRLARDLELSRIEVARAERVLAWGEMARQVAHEIKNPLTPIRLGVQHLRRARMDKRVDFDRVLEDNVTRILSEIDRLDEIARAFSRYGSAPSELPPPERIDVAAILRDVVALEQMGVGDVSWTISGAEDGAYASARDAELRDVLLNLFENARLARARRVDVRVRRLQKTVVIEIADNGAGINELDLPRVFEPHFSTRTTGSGLGLAISRRLLESWGGTIEIDSEEGKGAQVVLTLQSAT